MRSIWETRGSPNLQVAHLVCNGSPAKSINDSGGCNPVTSSTAKQHTLAVGLRRATRVHQRGLQRLQGTGSEEPQHLDACLSLTHACPYCGLVLDSGAYAAGNIRQARQARQRMVAFTAVQNCESPSSIRQSRPGTVLQ
jgi:hypothetical protein